MGARPETDDQPATCPRCGANLSYAMGGLCPRCIAGVTVASSGSGHPSPAPIPSVEELSAALPEIEIEELIGRGGMGAVFRGRQIGLDRRVAVKVLAVDTEDRVEFVERFRIEAQALAKLSHPNIVAVHDFGEREGFVYIVMEFVPGTDLAQLIADGDIDPSRSLELVIQICSALQYAHDAGVVHRDIKPGNILIDPEGKVRIADFGLAKLLGSSDAMLTTGGDRLGTPLYMAPEQRSGMEGVDHRADIYSLGVVFYEMLTGQLPSGKVAPPSRCARAPVSPRVDPVVMKSMEPEPRRRFQQASEVGERVERIQSGRRRWPVALAAGLVLGALGVGWMLSAWNRGGTGESPAPSAIDSAASAQMEVVVFEPGQRAEPIAVRARERAGQALALRPDGGGMVLLGTPQGINRDAPSGPGYVAVLTRDAEGAWVETHRFTAPGGREKGRFGHAVVADERQVIVNSSRSKLIHIYDAPLGQPPAEWQLVQEIPCPEGLPGADFGTQLALSGDTLVVCARKHRGGVAIVYQRGDSGQWREVIWLRPAQDSDGLHFANGVAMADGVIAVTSRFFDHPGYPDCGCVDLFERDSGGEWAHVTRLMPQPLQRGLWAGHEVAFDGSGRLLMGALADPLDGKVQGSVQVFERQPGASPSWQFVGKLHAPRPHPHSGNFGRRIVIDGDRLYVGSDNFNPAGSGRVGCVYEFVRDERTPMGWRPTRQFLPSPDADGDWSGLGYEIAVNRDWLAFGIPNARGKAGGAYVFPRH